MNPRKTTHSAMVYFNTREKVFLVVAQGVLKNGMKGEIGDPVLVRDADFENQIPNAVLAALDSFERNMYLDSKMRRYSDEEYRRFKKAHLAVSVQRRHSGEVIVIPLHHSKGGYSGEPEEGIIVFKEHITERLAVALRKAFDLAT